MLARQAEIVHAYLSTGGAGMLDALPPPLASEVMLIRAALIDCRVEIPALAMARATVHLASAVDAHLAPARREALWKRLSNSGCRSAAAAQPWLALHSAIAAEDGPRITAAASRLLQGDVSPDLLPYTLAAQMTGLLLRGDGPASLRAFQEHGKKVSLGDPTWDPVFRLLVGVASKM